MIKIVVTGACGKVGSAIIRCALEDADFEIVGLVEAKTHPDIGKPSTAMTEKTDKPLLIEADFEKTIQREMWS